MSDTINVRMPDGLVAKVDEEYEKRGFSNRSEFIRFAVRDALEVSDPYSEEAKKRLTNAYKQYEANKTSSFADVVEEAGFDSSAIPSDDDLQLPTQPIAMDEAEFADMATVKIVGVGGAGLQIVSQLHDRGLTHADTIAIDTDKTDLIESVADTKLHLPLETDSIDQKSVREAAQKSQSRIAGQLFAETDLVIILSGVGGVTGTGLTPVVSEAAQQSGATVLSITTLPHTLEEGRRRTARDDLSEFAETSDTLVIVDAARFASLDPDLPPGRIFKDIDQHIVSALIQMVDHRDSFSIEESEFEGLRSLFEDGGYATLATASAMNTDDIDTTMDSLYNHSLVERGSSRATEVVHLVRFHPEQVDVDDLVHRFSRSNEFGAHTVFTSLLADSRMSEAAEFTSILTGLDLSVEELVQWNDSTDSSITDSEGFVMLSDSSAEDRLDERILPA